LRDVLAAYEIPRRIVAVDNIPRFETGKVDRNSVVEIVGKENVQS
jgi:fatty-acyl-CoA synthase/O-succinylbenzoic acid--CoA ligase